MADHLTPTDASMLAIEDADHGMHLQIIYVFEGEPPTFEEFAETVEKRLLGAPRFRQRVKKVPYGLGRPVWVDDERFDLGYHLRRTALPAPGSEDELRTLSNRLLQQPLDLRRAPWEMWMVEGLEHDRFAIIHRVHHCMVDGVATQDISGMMFSRTPHEERAAVDEWQPAGQPGGIELVASGIADFAAKGGQAVSGILRAARSPRSTLGNVAQDLKTLGRLSGVTSSAPSTMLNRQGGPRRRTDWVRVSLDDLKATKKAHGTTINNVVLAASTGALRRYFVRQGEPLPLGMRAMVPVSVRLDDERGVLSNRVSAIFPVLPLDEEDPGRRVSLIAAEVERLRGTEGVAMQRIMDMGGFAPPTIMGQIQRLLLLNEGAHNLVISNVPGPAEQLYLRGRPLREVLPSGTTTPRHNLNMPMVSYNGTFFIAISTDPDTVPDGAGFAKDLEDSYAELLDLAREAA